MRPRILAYGAFYACLCALLAYLVRRNLASLAALPPSSLLLLAPFPALSLAQMAVAAQANRTFFAGHMRRNSLAANVRLGLVGLLGNLMPVSLGLVSKGIYARRRHELPYPAYFAFTAYQFGAGMAWSGIACLAFAAQRGGAGLLVAGAAFLAAAGVPFLDASRWLPARWRARLAADAYRAARAAGRRRFAAQFAWQGASQILNAAMLYLVFHALGLPVAAWQAFVIFVAANVSRYVGFTPGGLGVPEGLGAAASVSLGIPFPMAFMALSAMRVLDIACALICFPILFHGGVARAGLDPAAP